MSGPSRQHRAGALRAAWLLSALGGLLAYANFAYADVTLSNLKAGEPATIAIANDPPFMSLDSSGQPVGLGPELDKAILEQIGIKNVTGEVVGYGAMIPAVLARRALFASGGALNIKPERCQAVLFSNPLFCNARAFVMRVDISTHSFAEAAGEGLRIGVCGGCVEEKYAQEAGIAPDKLIIVKDVISAYKMLIDNRIDVLATDITAAEHAQRTSANPELTQVVEVVDAPLSCSAAAFHPDDGELLKAYNSAFEIVKSNGAYDELLRKYEMEVTAVDDATATTVELCGQ